MRLSSSREIGARRHPVRSGSRCRPGPRSARDRARSRSSRRARARRSRRRCRRSTAARGRSGACGCAGGHHCLLDWSAPRSPVLPVLVDRQRVARACVRPCAPPRQIRSASWSNCGGTLAPPVRLRARAHLVHEQARSPRRPSTRADQRHGAMAVFQRHAGCRRGTDSRIASGGSRPRATARRACRTPLEFGASSAR